MENLEARKVERCNGLYDLFKVGSLCDMEISSTFNGKTYTVNCHKVALVVASEYFHSLLIAGDCTSGCNIVDVGAIEEELLDEALDFVYQGKCNIFTENVIQLLDLSIEWKMNVLKADCLTFMRNNINGDTAVNYYELAKDKYDETELEKEASSYIRQHVESLVVNGNFLHISEKHLTDILSSDELNISKESTIYHTILKWKEAHPNESVDGLLQFIRYEYVDHKCLIEMLLDPLVQELPDLSKLVKQLLHGSGSGNDGQTLKSQNIRYWIQKKLNTEHVLYKVDKDYNLCKYVKEDWYFVQQLPDWFEQHSQAVTFGSKLHLYQPNSNTEPSLLIDVNSYGLTVNIPKLPHDIMWFASVYKGNIIYVTGGTTPCRNETEQSEWTISKEVYKLDLTAHNQKWEALEPMLYAVKQHESWYQDGHIYVVGGFCNDKSYMTLKAQRYDIATNTWKELNPWPVGVNAAYFKGLLINGNMNFFLKTERIIYDPDADVVTREPYASGELYYVATPVIYNGKVVVLTGKSKEQIDTNEKFCLKEYDHISKIWSDLDIDVSDCCGRALFFSIV